MIPVRSLGLATELALARTRGTVEDRGDYLVVRTPDDPGYFYGNLLVLPAAPQVGEVAFWTRRFADELGRAPQIRHVTLAWDGTVGDTGAADELAAAGFALEVNETLRATALAPIHAPPAPPIRPLAPDEVLAAADLAWDISDRHDEAFRAFLHRRARWHSHLVAAGRARFWGAYKDGALVASCGLVDLGEGRARYQDVQTAEALRGRGLASALLTALAQERAARELVIVAAPESPAARLYRRLGFVLVERTASACRAPTDAP